MDTKKKATTKPKTSPKTAPKRRGRKPKAQKDNKPKPTPKKRGRKPKEKVYSINGPITSKPQIDEVLILHLPITQKDLEEHVKQNNGLKSLLDFEYQPNVMSDPVPYDASSGLNEFKIIDSSNDVGCEYEMIYKENLLPDEKDVNIHNNNNSNNSDGSNDGINNDNNLSINDTDKKHTGTEIKNLNKKITKIKKIGPDDEILQIDDSEDKKLVKRNMKNIMFEFIDAKKKKTWPKTTNIWCKWCCHSFDTIPCAIPLSYINGKFNLYGNFCSFNCAAAYIFREKSYDYRKRYELLNLLYKKMFNTKFIKIKPAPPIELLKCFGGYMDITTYRENFTSINEYQVVIPPLIAIIPRIEESIYENKDDTFIPLDSTVMNNVKLRLKRDKPITNPKNTLESYMAVKVMK